MKQVDESAFASTSTTSPSPLQPILLLYRTAAPGCATTPILVHWIGSLLLDYAYIYLQFCSDLNLCSQLRSNFNGGVTCVVAAVACEQRNPGSWFTIQSPRLFLASLMFIWFLTFTTMSAGRRPLTSTTLALITQSRTYMWRWQVFFSSWKFRIISSIIKEDENSISNSTFLANFRMSELPNMYKKFVTLVGLLCLDTLLQ